MSYPTQGRAAQVAEIRNALGIGLVEANAAFLKYGSAKAALAALDPSAEPDESPYQRALHELASLRVSHERLKEALQSFVYEFGDKTNSATVNKARAALKDAP